MTYFVNNTVQILCREGKKQSFLFSLLYGLTQGIMYSMYAIAFRLGGYLVEKQEMSIDEIFK